MDMLENIIESCINIHPVLSVNVKDIVDEYIKCVPEDEMESPHSLLSDICVAHISVHPDYDSLASRILISRLHDKYDVKSYESYLKRIEASEIYCDRTKELLSRRDVYDFINYDRDYMYSIQALKTLMRSYLYEETPQEMIMRVSLGIHGEFNDDARETYRLMSTHQMTHATPTLFNSGTKHNQMSSCFLMPIKDDSIEGIFDTAKDMAIVSKHCGGLGISVSNVRSRGSKINRNNGVSNGIIPMIRVLNSIADYVDQGGKRKAACAIYLEPWHSDIEEFLELKINHGDVNLRARELFYSLWINDIFMERVERDEIWSLFCPNTVPLYKYYGDEFREVYEKAERDKLYVYQMPSRKLWNMILRSQIETGGPFMMYKDACNEKSNQKNLGTIRSSNLCTEIVQYSSAEETAVCTIGSISLTSCVENGEFNFDKLGSITRQMVRNLDKIVDCNMYSIESARLSAERHRAIGVGVQGLANVFFKLRLPFTSDEAKELNRRIFERIYFEALSESVELAKINGPYSTYEGSPISRGILQQDMWEGNYDTLDWSTLRANIAKYGVRNSLLTAPMPTASTSQILDNVDCFEPIHANIYNRKTISGDCLNINKYLVRDLLDLGLWNESMRDKIIRHDGSIQLIEEIPKNIRDIYKTAWELKARDMIDMSADRGRYIDQSQSFTIFVPHHAENDIMRFLTSVHFHSWKKGCKTGMYYLRSQPGANPTKVTISVEEETSPVAIKDNTSMSMESSSDEDSGSSISYSEEDPSDVSDIDQLYGPLNDYCNPKRDILWSDRICTIDNPECESCQG